MNGWTDGQKIERREGREGWHDLGGRDEWMEG